MFGKALISQKWQSESLEFAMLTSMFCISEYSIGSFIIRQ